MAVFGQIELAGTPWYCAAVLDPVEEIRLFERLQELRADVVQLRSAFDQVADQRIQTPCVYTRLALESLQDVKLMIQFLVGLATHIAARQNGQDLK